MRLNSTSIAYRIVHENLPKYFDNIKVYDQIMATSISEQVAELESNLCVVFENFGKRRISDMIRILTDTASDFDLEEAAELGVTMLPMEITIGDESFRDRYDLTPDRFYEMLIESSDLPHTSQINSYAFEQEYIKIQAAGDSAIVILMSSKLSGTYQNAVIAAKEYENIRVPGWTVQSLTIILRTAALSGRV